MRSMGTSKRRVVVSVIAQVMVLAALLTPTPHIALSQYCAPAMYTWVDARLRGDHVELVITNIDSQPRGGYSASVWAEQTSNHQVVVTDTFTVPMLQPHAQYSRSYDAGPFVSGQIDAFFRWNAPSCTPWPGLFFRCWTPAYSNFVTQPADEGDGLDSFWDDIVQSEDLGEGY